MSKFNLTNYESYFIDYLEGNLSEEDRHAFELFLDKHPSLQLEGELPIITMNDNQNLSKEFVNQLRVFDEKEEVNENTIDGFLIASTEGILFIEKQQELQAYLLMNPRNLNSLGVYHKTKLKPDLEITFPNKQVLRKGNTRRLIFGVVSGVAAIFLGVVFLFPTNETFYHQAKKLDVKSNTNNYSTNFKAIEKQPTEFLQRGDQLPVISDSIGLTSKSELAQQPVNSDTNINTNLVIVPQEMLTNLEPNQSQITSKTKEVENAEYLAFEAMKSPIEPILKFGLKKLRDNVDFRYAKATKTKQGGFYLKLWNFEVSRKVSAISDLTVN